MKIKAEVFLNSQKNIFFKKILITGSDETLITYVKTHIIEDFKKKNYYIDFSNNHNSNLIGNLFS